MAHFVEIGDVMLDLDKITFIRKKGDGPAMTVVIYLGDKVPVSFRGAAAAEVYQTFKKVVGPKVWQIADAQVDAGD